MRLSISASSASTARLRLQVRNYASQVPSKGPLIYGFRPPAAPSPPSSSSAPSPKTPAKSTETKSSPSASSSAPSIPLSTLPKPRLNYNALISNPELTTLNAVRRAAPLSSDHMAHLTRLRETQVLLLQKLSTIRAKQREIGSLIKTGLGDMEENKRQAKKLKLRVKEYENTLSETESELFDLALILPNFSHPASPIGKEDQAKTLETFGPDLIPADGKRDHVDFANYYGLLDNQASAITSGSSWPYLVGTLALLEQALINYALSIAIKHGFTPVIPPDVIKSDIAWRCGFQPRDSADNPSTQTYHIASTSSASPASAGIKSDASPGTANAGPQLCLAGTSEIPLAGMFADRIYHQEELPKKIVGIGRAFRAEAGARGADTRGLYRVHQFTKVELFAVTPEDGSEGMMEEIRGVQKEIAQGLGLSVRVLDMPTEELGASAHRKYDMEAWMPGRGKWGEITSTSNCTDYQSRRLSITYRPSPGSSAVSTSTSSSSSSSAELSPNTSTPPPPPSENTHNGPLPFAHTLNGTAAAIPRLIVALLEIGIRFKSDSESESVSESGSKAEAKLGVGNGAEQRGMGVEYEGLNLPKVLERFWVGGDELAAGSAAAGGGAAAGKKRGLIKWV